MDLVQEPRLMQTLRAHRSEVMCVEAAGARLATGGDRTLVLWRWVSGQGWEEEARAVAAHRYGVTTLRWAASGMLLASGGVDGATRVWCGRTLTARRTLGAPRTAAVRALCWASRARLLAGHDDGALCVWHVERTALLARLAAHEGALHAVCAPAHGALLLTACTDGVLKVFDLAEVIRRHAEEGAAPAPLTWVDGAHDLGALCADASQNGMAAATGGHDALVRVWHVEPGARGLSPHMVLAGHGAAVTALRWAACGQLLASVSLDRTARLWAVGAGTPSICLHVLHAHSRYLTCVALARDLRYMLTGSNDKSVKMWSLGTLTLDDELEPPCVALDHFALGDLEGIEPLLEEADAPPVAAEPLDGDSEGSGVKLAWNARLALHGPINSITTHDDWLATASSDGWVRVYSWCELSNALVLRHALEAHQYPCLAVDAAVGGAVLLSAGLDGRACLWDVQSGVQLRVLSTGGVGVESTGGESGGGGVRGARLSPCRPSRVLLATDDGIAPLWSIDSDDTKPACVYGGHAEGVCCCAWSKDGRLAATGAASGELRVLAPPSPAVLHHEAAAHEHGVQSCDFAPPCTELELLEHSYLLATGGCDALLKLWILDTQQDEGFVSSGQLRLVRQVEAHGGGVASVRWAAHGRPLLVTAGADGWARVWRVKAGGGALEARGGARAGGAGGVLAAVLLLVTGSPPLLACGTLSGELSVWRLPPDDLPEQDPDEGTHPSLWTTAGVVHWLRENVFDAPGAQVNHEDEASLIRRVHDNDITGSRLVNDPIDSLLEEFGYGAPALLEDAEVSDQVATRERLRAELCWLRLAPLSASDELALTAGLPHGMLCPLTHLRLSEPARAADGYSYERANILDWFLAADGAVSPISSQRLRNSRVVINYALRDSIRAELRARGFGPKDTE